MIQKKYSNSRRKYELRICQILNKWAYGYPYFRRLSYRSQETGDIDRPAWFEPRIFCKRLPELTINRLLFENNLQAFYNECAGEDSVEKKAIIIIGQSRSNLMIFSEVEYRWFQVKSIMVPELYLESGEDLRICCLDAFLEGTEPVEMGLDRNATTENPRKSIVRRREAEEEKQKLDLIFDTSFYREKYKSRPWQRAGKSYMKGPCGADDINRLCDILDQYQAILNQAKKKVSLEEWQELLKA